MQHVFYTQKNILLYTTSKTAKKITHSQLITSLWNFIDMHCLLHRSFQGNWETPTSTSPLISFNICSRFSLLSTFTWETRKLVIELQGADGGTTGGPFKKKMCLKPSRTYPYQKQKIKAFFFVQQIKLKPNDVILTNKSTSPFTPSLQNPAPS